MKSRKTIRRPGRGLTARQKKFALEYAATLNATAAAKRAGYGARSARFRASKLLANVAVASAIREALERSFTKAQLSIERIDAALAAVCFSDIRRFYDANGRLLPTSEWPADVAAAVAGLETIERAHGKSKATTQVTKVKLWDKVSALTLAARRLGMLKDNLKLSGGLTLEQLVLASYAPRDGHGK